MKNLWLAIALLLAGAAFVGAYDARANPRTIYLSTGDHQDLLWAPLDSKVSIETAFDTLQKLYGAERIWWRGGQDEIWAKQFVFRPENRSYDLLWRWWRRLAFEKVGTNRLAVKTARGRGLKIWMAYGLFDNGSTADVGFTGFPYAAEDRLRVEHPEYAPLNRWGTWRQGGPVEFAYAGVRKGMVDYIGDHLIEAGYDGVAFLTYAENHSQRYDDEFGFNEPIVAEFKRRHGVDIRRQPFDKQAWSRLRGEYVTQFFRELRAKLARGIKIAVCVDGKDPSLPTRWSSIEGGLRSAGLIHLDVANWAKEKLVDEVTVWAPPDDAAAALERCRELCRGTATVASAFRTRGPLPAGVPRVMFLGGEFENGFPWEHYIDFADEKIPPQSIEVLTHGDAYARRRLLTAVLKKKQRVPAAALVAATKDADLYVRRRALHALAATGDAAGVPAIEAALTDGEHSVRLAAATAIGRLPGPDAVEHLFEAVAREPDSFQLRFHAVPEALKQMHAVGKLTPKQKEPIVGRLSDPNPAVREAALFAFERIGAPATPAVEAALAKIVKDDPSAYAREMALVNMRSSFGPSPATLVAVRLALNDRDEAVQVRALLALAILKSQPPPSPGRKQALDDVTSFFRRYGEGCRRTDKDWGWRVAGEALLSFGAEGEVVLAKMMTETKDRRLAEIAWRVVYLRQGDRYYRTSEADDRKAHALRPLLAH